MESKTLAQPEQQEVKRIIEQLDDLFISPSVWVKNTLALDYSNSPVNVTSPDATKFCVRGGIMRLMGTPSFSEEDSKKVKIRRAVEDIIKKFINAPLTVAQVFFLTHDKLVAWNNAPGTSFQDLKDALAKAKEYVSVREELQANPILR
jgi:hypothetical protein